PFRQNLAGAPRVAGAIEAAKAGIDAEEREGAGARRSEIVDRRQRPLEQDHRRADHALRGRIEHGIAQRPERATVGILAADALLPDAVEAHEVPEAARLGV